jgi:hypothetical protein
MARFSAKQRKMRGLGKPTHRGFIQLPWYVKRSKAYHGLSAYARAALIEIIDRWTGNNENGNNGYIGLGVRELAYELNCSQNRAWNALRELEDARLIVPTQIGQWRGRLATEWRLAYEVCKRTGDLPERNFQPRPRYVERQRPRDREPLTNAERQRRHRERRNETEFVPANSNGKNRNDEFAPTNSKVRPGEFRRYVSSPPRTRSQKTQ